MRLVRRLVVAVAGRKHDALHSDGHHLIEMRAHAVGIGAVKEGGVGRDAKTAFDRFLDALDSDVVAALAANGEVMMIALAVQMNGEGKVLRRRELVQPLLEFERVGAHIHILLTRNQSVYDVHNLRMQQRFAAGDGHHGHAALFHGRKTLLGRELLLQNMRRILHFAAARAGQVAAEQRLQHEHQRKTLVAFHPLLEHIACHRPHL